MNIGRYQLVEKLGQGGMGVVYRAFDTLLHRVVAVKLISGSVESGTEQRERFFREARAAGQLSHRHIITIHDLGEHEGQPYLAMEYLEGEDLQRRLGRPDRMSLAHKVGLAIEICEGLEYAHARGIVHRDIKPANIFITTDGTARILDFGLARLVTSELTNSNMMMGTMNYMAPEQVRGERADQRSDIFSVGALIYELLSGRKAFERDSFASTMYRILQEDPEPLLNIDPSLPPDLVAIVNRALAKPRDERYQSMSEMLRDLAVARQQIVAYDSPAFGRPVSAAAPRPSDPPQLRPLSDPGSDAPTMPAVTTPFPVTSTRPPSGTPLPSTAPAGSPVIADVPSGSTARPASLRRAGWVAAALLVLAVAAFAVWSTRSSQRSAPPLSTPATTQAIDNAAIATAVREATQALEAGNLADAQRRAEAALALAPSHPEARRIRERATETLDRMTRGLREARAHYEAGRFEEASRAAGDVLSLVPNQPEARKLMQEAASRSRGQGAAEARTRMNQTKAAARAASAGSLAASSYAAALTAERTAQRLYDAGQLAEATAKFYEASGLFHSAELAAQSEAAARAEHAAAANAEKARVAKEQHTGRAGAPPGAPTTQPVRPVPPEPVPSVPVARGTDPLPIGSTPVPSAPPPPKAPVTAPAPAPSEPSAESLIAELLAGYKAALESRNLAALKRLWPGLSGSLEAAFRDEFLHAKRIDVEIASPRVTVTGATATVTFVRRYEVQKTDGQLLSNRNAATMSLRRNGAGWVIDQIRFDPLRKPPEQE
jgi:eukaryotic-like serine/threonine-protein kinase